MNTSTDTIVGCAGTRERTIRSEGFRLIYGDPVAGYQMPAGGPAPETAKRACLGLTELAAAAWPYAKEIQASTDHQWPDFAPDLVDTVREHFPELPPAAVALALRIWGRIHGLIALEIYGHLGPQTSDPAKLYHAELLDLLRSLGLDAEHARHPGTPRSSV